MRWPLSATPRPVRTTATIASPPSAEIVRLGAETGDRQLELLGLRLRIVALLEIGDVGAADVAVGAFRADRRAAAPAAVPLVCAVVAGDARPDARRAGRGRAALRRRRADRGAGRQQQRRRAHLHPVVGAAAVRGAPGRGRFGDGRPAGSGRRPIPGSPPDRARWSPRSPGTTPWPAPCSPSGWPPGCPTGPGTPSGSRSPPSWPRSRSRREPATRPTRLYADLRPYAHRFCVEGIGAAFTGSVAWYLAQLATFLGRAAEADGYAAQARAAHARVGLIGDPPPLGGVAEPAAPAPAPATGRVTGVGGRDLGGVLGREDGPGTGQQGAPRPRGVAVPPAA